MSEKDRGTEADDGMEMFLGPLADLLMTLLLLVLAVVSVITAAKEQEIQRLKKELAQFRRGPAEIEPPRPVASIEVGADLRVAMNDEILGTLPEDHARVQRSIVETLEGLPDGPVDFGVDKGAPYGEYSRIYWTVKDAGREIVEQGRGPPTAR